MLKKEHFPVTVAAILAGILVLLAFSMHPTFGSWSAQITNIGSSAGTSEGKLVRTCYDEMKLTSMKYGGYLYHFHTSDDSATNDSYDRLTWRAKNGNQIKPNSQWFYADYSQASSEPCLGVSKHAYFPGGNSTRGGALFSGINSRKATINVTADAVRMPDRFTTETWINTSEAQGTIVVNSIFGTYDRPVWRVQVLGDGRAAFQVRQTPLGVDRIFDQAKSSTRVDDGKWHQIVSTWDYATREMKLFIDGEQEVAKTSISGLYRFDSRTEGYIRYGYSGGNYNWPEGDKNIDEDNFLGYMAFAAVYADTVSASDVKRHWEARKGVMGWPEK